MNSMNRNDIIKELVNIIEQLNVLGLLRLLDCARALKRKDE